MKKARFYLIILFLSTFLISFSSLISDGNCYEIDDSGTVTYIVDGDTVDVSSVGRIRLADIDAPDAGEAGKEAATNYISSLIYQKTVYIDIDDVYGTDKYGRIVAVLYVYYDANHVKNVNKAMLDSGHATIWNFDNEFDPYSWNLIEPYPPGSTPPPDDPPPDDPPPDDPPPDDPPPDDSPPDDPPPDDPLPSNNGLDPQLLLTIGIISLTTGVISVTGVYAYKYLTPNKRKVSKLSTSPKPILKTSSYNSQLEASQSRLPNSKPSKKISDIKVGDKNLHLTGKVSRIDKVHEFTKQGDQKGKVGSFILTDSTKSIYVVLWDDKTSFLNNHLFTLGREVEIDNAYSKLNTFQGRNTLEVHLSKYSKLTIN